MKTHRFWVLFSLVLGGAALRLIPHPANFSPIGAIAIFAGSQFANTGAGKIGRSVSAFLVPLFALFLSDLVLGFHDLMPTVYVSFLLIVALGVWGQPRLSKSRWVAVSFTGSLLFFTLTNYAVWNQAGSIYPHTLNGLSLCFVAALPFLQNTVLGDLFYSGSLFSALWVLENSFPTLQPSKVR
jgi:hypothetical protein